MTEPNRVDKSIMRHVKLGLVLSSHSPPGSVTLAWVTTRPRPTLLSMDTRQPRRVRRIASQTGIGLPTPSLIDALAEQNIAYVPYFPLGGFTPLQSDVLALVALRLDTAPMAVAIAWLLQRSPNILLIPGTSSVAHLYENVAAASLVLSEDDVAELEAIDS